MQDDHENNNLQQPFLEQQAPQANAQNPHDAIGINIPPQNLVPAQPQAPRNCSWIWWAAYFVFGGVGAYLSGFGLYDISQNDQNGYFFFSLGVTIELGLTRLRLRTPQLQRVTEGALVAGGLFTVASYLNVVLGEQPIVHFPSSLSFSP